MRDRAVWLLRASWFVLPITTGSAIEQATGDLSDYRRTTLMAACWFAWAAGMICTAILLPITLTASRVLVPLGLLVSAAAIATGEANAMGIIGLPTATIATALVFSSLVGDRMVDGASYGDERRMLLRPPTGLLVGPALVAWIIAASSLAAGPILLARWGWAIGLPAIAIGGGLAFLAGRSLHQLTRRWIVFVPTGFVLHDLLAITEPVLFRRTAVERLGPAIEGTPARDLTMGAAGLLLECELTDPAPVGVRSSSARTGVAAELTDVRRFMFVPSRPGALLDEAERRRLAVAT